MVLFTARGLGCPLVNSWRVEGVDPVHGVGGRRPHQNVAKLTYDDVEVLSPVSKQAIWALAYHQAIVRTSCNDRSRRGVSVGPVEKRPQNGKCPDIAPSAGVGQEQVMKRRFRADLFQDFIVD